MSESERDARLSTRGQSAERDSRASKDRPVKENRELTEADRLEMFRSQFFQSALPTLPDIPGFHICWLTTTNPRDTIQMRTRLGYEPVRAEEIPGWQHATLKTGDYAGCIGINELLAYKLPIRLYEMYMREAHHNQPLQEELKLKAVLDVIRKEAEEAGADVEEGEGTAELGKAHGRPMFEGV